MNLPVTPFGRPVYIVTEATQRALNSYFCDAPMAEVATVWARRSGDKQSHHHQEQWRNGSYLVEAAY
jgi:hypothetical protein